MLSYVHLGKKEPHGAPRKERVNKDVQKAVVDKFGKDDEAAIINASDEITKAFTKAQLPQELDDLVNEWLHVEGNQKSIFANNIPTGKNRSYEAVLFLGTQWEPSKLIEKTALQLMKINVDMSYKRIQELHTVKYMLLMGAPITYIQRELSKP